MQSQADYAKSGLPGTAADTSWEAATAFAAHYTALHPSARYRLPTEAEWEFLAQSSAAAGVTIGEAREWVGDWHAPYLTARLATHNPTGPSVGVLKVVRGGGGAAGHTTRYSLPPGATASGSPTEGPSFQPPTTFRLVKAAASGSTTSSSSYAAPAPFPQAAVLTPSARQSGSGGLIELALLGPPASAPHFTVEWVLPIPPDSEAEGWARCPSHRPAALHRLCTLH